MSSWQSGVAPIVLPEIETKPIKPFFAETFQSNKTFFVVTYAPDK